MSLPAALWLVVALFPISEIALNLLRRSREPAAETLDRGSMRLIWIAIAAGLAGAIAAQWVPAARLAIPLRTLRLVALILILAGLAIRWVAILTLGRFFTVDVAIQKDHSVVEKGPYRFVRHPSYAGMLLAFVGVGVSFASWLSFVLLLVPITLAVMNRVVREEQALLAALGAPYADYCRRTRRFIPGLL